MAVAGCHHPTVTAVPLSAWNRDEPGGIPFYLPKPLLVVSKNFRNIEESTIGLTNSSPIPGYFDDQGKFADVNSRSSFQDNGQGSGNSSTTTSTTNVTNASGTGSAPVLHSNGAPISPAGNPKDGLDPATFFTYQIIFVPDLSQKYGLKIKGGAGEIRAAMNLVNGWMFTGLGPYYIKDSSTAQNVLAGGIAGTLALRGVGDVLKNLNNLQRPGGEKPQSADLDAAALQELSKSLERFSYMQHGERRVECIPAYAEIWVYEPVLNFDGTTCWREVANHQFGREFLTNPPLPVYDFKKDKPQGVNLSKPIPQPQPPPAGAAGTSGTPSKPMGEGEGLGFAGDRAQSLALSGDQAQSAALAAESAKNAAREAERAQNAALQAAQRLNEERLYSAAVEQALRLPTGTLSGSGDRPQNAPLPGASGAPANNVMIVNHADDVKRKGLIDRVLDHCKGALPKISSTVTDASTLPQVQLPRLQPPVLQGAGEGLGTVTEDMRGRIVGKPNP